MLLDSVIELKILKYFKERVRYLLLNTMNELDRVSVEKSTYKVLNTMIKLDRVNILKKE